MSHNIFLFKIDLRCSVKKRGTEEPFIRLLHVYHRCKSILVIEMEGTSRVGRHCRRRISITDYVNTDITIPFHNLSAFYNCRMGVSRFIAEVVATSRATRLSMMHLPFWRLLAMGGGDCWISGLVASPVNKVPW